MSQRANHMEAVGWRGGPLSADSFRISALDPEDSSLLAVESQARLFGGALCCVHLHPFPCDLIERSESSRAVLSEYGEHGRHPLGVVPTLRQMCSSACQALRCLAAGRL